MFARFPLELDAFGDEELGAHLASVHKYCQFCNEYFYGEGGGQEGGEIALFLIVCIAWFAPVYH